MSSPKPNETSAHPKTPAHDSHATHQPYVSAQPYGYFFPPPGLPHPQQQVGHPIMPGGPGSGALLNHFGSTTPAPVHGQPMDPKSVPTHPHPRLLPRINCADFILPDEFSSPFNTHTPSYRAPPVPPPLSPEIASVGGGGNDSTKAKTKKVDKKVVVKPKATVKDDNNNDSNDDDKPGPKRGRTKGSSQYTDKEHTEITLVDACAAGSAIKKKVALGDLQDEDIEDINVDDEEDNNKVLTITSDSDEDTNKKAAKKKGKKPAVGTILTKAYKTKVPLWPTSRKTQSTNFLEKISLTLDPAAMQQRDENRLSANFQLLMLQSYQSQITTLTTQVNEERRRADDAESELRMLPTPHVQAVLLYAMNGGVSATQ
ncbi:hypothetical protein DFJ43DRAFT_1155288 [Lentinula guzmanii]|uniref:Uncharacterized protein n=1 Tax=Lentinula guzmanii TaxID=2804957 RepID=A0AA38JF73_9AGAR|nr:hypothetical protein DFJ43DRAFT_1155288 [Lentinula guzmanii]